MTLPTKIPNAFSPNDDGINDFWELQGFEKFNTIQIQVYNRWGNRVYEDIGAYSFDMAWDGGNYPVGTYYYIVRITDPTIDDANSILQGAVTVTK